jgi:hypothetical protein
LVLITVLLALRLPAFVEPVGNDQSLYLYEADRVRAGGVPYLDAWDHKPPGIAFVYAALRTVWPWPSSTVAFGDFVAATLTAWLLVILGRRLVSLTAGYLAASTFLLLGHPSIARLGGIYQRGQCEVFIALAVTAAIVLVWPRARRSVLGERRPLPDHEVRWPLALAGVCLAAAFWLKYNAIAYALPILTALLARPTASSQRHARLREALWVAAGFLALSVVVGGYFGARHALYDLRLATIDYNLQYSSETYAGITGALTYVVSLPFSRAKADLLWYVGGVGAALLIVLGRERRPATLLACAWIAAAIISIAVNGARGLPQYFVQAGPALALAFAAGVGMAAQRGRGWKIIAALLVIAGLWKVGVEAPLAAGIRLGGLPQLVANVSFDLRFAGGRLDRQVYLARFEGEQKYDAAEVDALAALVRDTTAASDPILVFGFAPGIYVQSNRVSASRFFWSRPVILEFASDTPGYGSRGLLADLERSKPAMVILQKQDWRPYATDSMEFFLTTPPLSHWLLTGYGLEQDTPRFTVWRKNR